MSLWMPASLAVKRAINPLVPRKPIQEQPANHYTKFPTVGIQIVDRGHYQLNYLTDDSDLRFTGLYPKLLKSYRY